MIRMKKIVLSTALFLCFFIQLSQVQCQINGDEICIEGFVMDKFCVDLGTLLDKPDLISLQYPGEHSLHCLVDVKSCYESPFLILREPVGGSMLYTIAYQVDDNGREILIALARASGLSGSYPACSTCTNEGDGGLLQGFRAEVFGIITDSSGNPPVLTVTSANVSNGRATSDICVMQQISNSPTTSPQTVAPVPIVLPTSRPITTKPITAAPSSLFPINVMSSSPSSNPDAPTLGLPSLEPLSGDFSEQPLQKESLLPSYAPDYESFTVAPVHLTDSMPTPSSNMTAISSNTTTNNDPPTSTIAGSQNDDGNSTTSACVKMHMFHCFLVVMSHCFLVGAVASYW